MTTIMRWLIIYITIVFAVALIGVKACSAGTLEEVATSPDTFAACKAVDIASTAYLLKTGIATESNPIVAPLITHGYFPLAALSIGVYWLMTKYHNATANTVANGVTCGVAASNLLLIP